MLANMFEIVMVYFIDIFYNMSIHALHAFLPDHRLFYMVLVECKFIIRSSQNATKWKVLCDGQNTI